MKFKAPEGATSVNCGGEEFSVVDGILTVPDHGDYATILAPHGYVAFNIPSDSDVDAADAALRAAAEAEAEAELAAQANATRNANKED